MIKFTKAEIDRAREYFRNQKFEEATVTFGNRTFSYFIVPQIQEPKLPNFVIRLTGQPCDGYVLGISDNVDARYRNYAVVHEFIEFTEIGIDFPNRCVRALEEELKLVPPEIKKGYIIMRRNFFRDLIPYCSKQPKFYTPQDLAQFEHNLETLERLLKE